MEFTEPGCRPWMDETAAGHGEAPISVEIATANEKSGRPGLPLHGGV